MSNTSSALPKVGISVTPLTVDQQDNLLAPVLVQSATYTDASGRERTGASLLNLSLRLDGTLPEAGLVVNVTADKDLYRIFSGLSRPIFTPGAQILGPLFNPAGETIGFQVRLLTPNPVIALRVNNNTLLPNELTRINFSVQPGDGYTVNNTAATTGTRVFNNLASVPAVTAPPEVTFTATNTTLVETEGNSVTFNFKLSAPPPQDGVIVKVTSDAVGTLGDFDVFGISTTGGAYPVGVGSNGFFFKLTSQEASLTVPVFADDEVEGLESFKFTVQNGFGYTVNPNSRSVDITIKDTPDTTLPLVSLTGSPATLVEAAETISRHTFNLSIAPPAQGFLVSVDAPNLDEFNLDRIRVTGGEIAAVTADGFTLKMTARTAVIELPVKNDGVVEGRETAVFSLKPAANYIVSSTANKAEFNILDVAPPITAETESNDTLTAAQDLGLSASNSKVSISGAIDYNAANSYRARPSDAGLTFVDPTEDVDLYKVTLKAGDKIAIDIDARQLPTPSTLNSVLRIFDANGRELAVNNNGAAPDEIFLAGLDSYLEFTATTDGVYYIGVSASPNLNYNPNTPGSGIGQSTGNYVLNVALNPTVQPVAPIAPVPVPADAPTISLDAIQGSYLATRNGENIQAPNLVESLPEGASVLSLVLKANGEIPEGGVDVIINSNILLENYFRNLNNRPFAIGGRVVEAVYDPATGRATGIKFNMTEANAVINLNVLNNNVVDGPRQANFFLDSGAYQVGSTPVQVTFYDDLSQVPKPANEPTVSLEVSNSLLVESLGNSTVLTLKSDQPIPAEGLLVYIDSKAARAVGQFDIFNAKIEGGIFPAGNFQASGFFFKMTEQTATIELAAFDDETLEGPTDYDFQIQPSAGYKVAANKNTASLRIIDTPDATKPVVSYTVTPATLVETLGTVSTHTFTTPAKLPAGGITIFVKADSLADFDFTKAEITGAKLVGITKDGFNLNLTSQSAVVRVPVKNDGKTEGKETATFTLQPGSTYDVNPESQVGTFTIFDGTGDFIPVENEGNTLATSNDTIAQAVDTKLGGTNTSFKIQAQIGNAPANFIDRTEDVDIYKVQLKAGDRIKIDIDSVPFSIDGVAAQQFVDTEIRLFDSTGRQLALSTYNAAPDESFIVTRDPYLEFFAREDGTYYIGVAANSNRYYDPNVAASGGGRVIPASGINIGRYDLAIDLEPYQKPEISFATTPTVISEAEGSILTLKFNTTGTIPPEGIVVELKGDTAGILKQFTSGQLRFDAQGNPFYRFGNVNVTGGILGALDSDVSSFKFTITKPNATIQFPVLDDLIAEPDQTYTYTLQPGEGFNVNPSASSATFTVTDGVPTGVGPIIGVTGSPTALYESEQTALTLTFTVNGALPPEGVVVVLDSGVARAIAEFDVTASNPRLPENQFTVTGPVVTGGRIVGTNELVSALLFRITEPTATLTVPVFQDDEVEGKETFTFRLLDGERYEVDPNASSVTFTIEDVRPIPTVSVRVSPDAISEAEGQFATFTFKVDGSIPSDGLVIATNDLFDPQFDFNFDFEDPQFLDGIEFFDYIVSETGEATVLWKLTKPEAFIKLKAFDDNIAEEDVESSVILKPREGYTIDPQAGSATVIISDGVPNVGGPVISLKVDKTQLTEGDTLTITLSAVGDIPADGLQVHLDTDVRGFLGEFELFDANRNFLPQFTGLKGQPLANEDASGFSVIMTGKTATITVKVFDDGEVEGTETFALKLLDGETYDVEPTASLVNLSISDPKPAGQILFGGNGDDFLTAGNGDNTIFAGEGNNVVTTGRGNDVIFAGAGNDFINAGAGNNTIFAGEGNNIINTGSGNDVIYAGAGNDFISSGAGDDIIYAGGGNNIIDAGAGDDIIYAGEGNNIIDAGTGNDTVFAGSGVDIFKLNKGDGFVTVFGFQSIDKFSLGTGLSSSDLSLTQQDGDTVISAGEDKLAVLKFTNVNSISIV